MNSILPSIMQSIKPFHCGNIAVGRKGYEIRKTKPNISTPFKSYIYCTIGQKLNNGFGGVSEALRQPLWKLRNGTVVNYLDVSTMDCFQSKLLNGKVIAEYICDEIQEWVFDNETNSYDISDDDLALTCLTQEQLWEYGKGKTLYGYHISNLKIYDEPKELSDFYTICNKDDLDQCGDCKYIESYSASFPCEDGGDWWCTVDNKKPLTRPFQSWGYVYEID